MRDALKRGTGRDLQVTQQAFLGHLFLGSHTLHSGALSTQNREN